jgi:hypothetical protein
MTTKTSIKLFKEVRIWNNIYRKITLTLPRFTFNSGSMIVMGSIGYIKVSYQAIFQVIFGFVVVVRETKS